MSYSRPTLQNEELLPLRDAYHIVWGAGDLAMGEATTSLAVKAYQGDEIGVIFDRLDQIRDDAATLLSALPENDLPLIRLGALIEPITDKIRDIYAQYNVGPDRPGSALGVHDDRIVALQGLDVFIRRSKSNLFRTRESSSNS